MKVKVYQLCYKLLVAISNKWNNKQIIRFKLMIGSSLLLWTTSLQGQNIPPDNLSNDNDTTLQDFEIKLVPPVIEEEIEEDIILCYIVVETLPEFPGGTENMMKFIAANIFYPSFLCDDIEGRVVVEFVVGRSGEIESPKILKSLHPILDAAALEVVRKMPKWKPALQRGKPVRVKYTLPVFFKYQ